MSVVADPEAALGKRVEPACAQSVDQDSDLNPVARGKRDRLQQRPPAGKLARQRLRESCESRLVEVEQRPGRELGDAAALVRHLGFAHA